MVIFNFTDEVLDELHILEKHPLSGQWSYVTNVQLTQTKNRDAVMFDIREARPKYVQKEILLVPIFCANDLCIPFREYWSADLRRVCWSGF